MRVAVIGMGKMGLLHSGILNAIPGVELVALCDKSFLIRRFLKPFFKGIAVVKNINELSRMDVDAVYVTTPISTHYPIVKTILSEKVASNLFVEKTLASNFDEARELRDLAEDYGGVNMVGYMRRFSVTFRKAKSLLDEEVLGEPLYFKAYAYSSDFFGVDESFKAKVPKVGVVRDLGCYAIDLALWFFGDLEVEGAKVESIVGEGCEDSAYVNVEAPEGLRGEFSFSWCVDKYRMPEVGFLIRGPEGTLNVNDYKVVLSLSDGTELRWFRQDLRDTVAFWLGSPEYFREDEYFVKSLACNTAAEPNFYTGAEVDRIIDEIRGETKR